jgi:hypothetical protein
MTLTEAVAHFGSKYRVAKVLGLTAPSITKWGDTVPDLRQLQLEHLSGGVLQADLRILRRHDQPKARG